MSVDLWIDRVARHAKVIVVRLLGGLDWWRYGVDRLSALARERGIALAVLPGEDRDDPRLAECSTLPPHELAALLRYFREGGRDNLRALLRRLARHAGVALESPRAAPRAANRRLRAGRAGDRSRSPDRDVWSRAGRWLPIMFYRSMLLAADVAPIDALCDALAARGLAPAPLFVAEPEGCRIARNSCARRCARLAPAVIVTTTAFAAGDVHGADAAWTKPASRCCRR